MTGEDITSEDRLTAILRPDQLQQNNLPYGNEDALTDQLYAQMRDTDSADPMVSLLHVADAQIDQTLPPGDELNQLIAGRAIAVVRDMRLDIPPAVRLASWRHLLDANWVHVHGNHSELKTAINHTLRKDGDFRAEFSNMIALAKGRKMGTLLAQIGKDTHIPGIDPPNFGHEGVAYVTRKHPALAGTAKSLALLTLLGPTR